MSLPDETEARQPDARRIRAKKYERALIVLAVLGLLLLVAIQRRLLNLGPGLSSNQGVITLVSINLSILTLALLLFLILKGLYRLFFERQAYGSLQTKMVVSFISLSLIPTLLIFYFAYRLVGRGGETWFSENQVETTRLSIAAVERALSVHGRVFPALARGALREFAAAAAAPCPGGSAPAGDGPGTADAAPGPGRAAPPAAPAFCWPGGAGAALAAALEAQGLSTLEWYGPDGRRLAAAAGQDAPGGPPPPLDAEAVRPSPPRDGAPALEKTALPGAVLRRLVLPLPGDPPGYLVAGDLVSEAMEANLAQLREGLRKSEAALGIERPFKVSQLTSLAAVTLLAVFLAVWIGSHLAGSLAAPVTELVEGTRRVAGGDLDFVLTPVHRSGEMADLVAAFNQMTSELRGSYADADRRRRFAETVLRQVSSGVLVLDSGHGILDMNQAASAMLRCTPAEARSGGCGGPVRELLDSVGPGRPRKAHARLRLPDGGTLSLMADRAALKDEGGSTLGWLITFDDVSELEKVQRLSAWREVARRIAHEIKNPLTPISLAVQRLRRKFAGRLAGEEDFPAFEESTEVILRQVDGMRRLVDEFSQFARLPQAEPRPADVARTAEETLALFRGAHPEIEFSLDVRNRPPLFLFDPEQIGRAVQNLLANACSAVRGAGRVELEIDLDPAAGVEITVSDDGPGVPPDIRDRIFEPYVTGGDGQGLGLAIVKAIVNEHGGFVRVFDRKPRGTSFTVTLPLREAGA
ncbi:MAG: HAMP domain-containing protein [Deltaproteobacteria bacterium]|jgi:two-component system nitrogen regulation sensor histidine kinase NtrY|nr:HAMP domain-containing protein [Deltaproteobacteria bacterium]